MERWAFFDVDGTVIEGDSFRHILSVIIASQPWRLAPALVLVPLFLATKWLKLDRRFAKSAMLWCATVGMGRKEAVRFLHHKIGGAVSTRWRPEASAAIQNLRAQGVHICYVSASGQTWLRKLLGIHDPGPKCIIGSRLGFWCGGVILTSPNCYQKEKLKRISQRLGDDLDWVAAYSDHPADIPLLAAARQRFVTSPRSRHLPAFRRALGDTFTVLEWRAPHHTSDDGEKR